MKKSHKNIEISRSAVEDRLVYGCSFPPFRSVDGKTNVQHIIPRAQSGIYVLAHKDGTYYIGLSINVGKRFEQHVFNKRPIAAYTFRKVRKPYLDIVETETIAILEDMGVKVTNTEKMKPEGSSQTNTKAIPPKDLTRWLNEDSWNILSGEIPKSPRPHSDIEECYQSEFLHNPNAQGILDFYSEFVKKCIYKPFQTAPDKWNVTCMPATRYDWIEGKPKVAALSLLNVGGQYVVLIIDDHRSIEISLAVKKSVFRRAHPNGVAELKRLAPSITEEETSVIALGDDQVDISVLLSEAKLLLKDRGLIRAIRAIVVHNRGMNQEGSSIYKRYHCYALAKDILSLIRNNP